MKSAVKQKKVYLKKQKYLRDIFSAKQNVPLIKK